MGLNLENVPEKGHFTIAEIAERWEVPESNVEYFIMEKGLRLAAYTRHLGINGLLVNLDTKDMIDIFFEVQKFLHTPSPEVTLARGLIFYQLTNTEMVFSDQKVVLPQLDPNKQEFPKYLYASGLLPESGYPLICTATLFDKQCAFFLANYSIDLDTGDYSDLAFFGVNKKIFRYISKEERDRFEKEYGITAETENVDLQVEALDYPLSSEVLKKLQAQINVVIREFPAWKDSVGVENIQNTESLPAWIKERTSANTREVEIIKKGLIEQFPELKKR